MKNHVLVLLGEIAPALKQELESAAPDWTFVYSGRDTVTQAQLQQAEVILGMAPRQSLRELEDLKWVQLSYAGADQYAAPGALPPGCVLTNATGAYGVAIGEFMVGMTLMLQKGFHLYRDSQLARSWQMLEVPARYSQGATVLVLGSGDIGGNYARRMKDLGATTIGVRRTNLSPAPELDEVHLTADLDRLLPRADVVAMALPGTPETAGIMSRKRLELMKPSAILINVGRGSAVDTDALADALREGRLGAAGLDVTDPEPLPPDHPLWQEPKAFITPHVAGISGSEGILEKVVALMAHNLRCYREGAPLKNVVDLNTGYRRL